MQTETKNSIKLLNNDVAWETAEIYHIITLEERKWEDWWSVCERAGDYKCFFDGISQLNWEMRYGYFG